MINTSEYSYILSFIVLEFAILFVLSISSLNVYSIILSGWSSGTKYAYLGGLRSASQMISYEVAIGLIILPIVFQTKSLRINDFVLMQKYGLQLIWMNMVLFIILVIAMLAETNRAPFDLPEAEAELVAGYNVEYSSTAFALFFLGEYSNMLVASTLIILLMVGSSLNVLFFAIKVIIVASFFVLVRATFPRYRYNQLMQIGWQIFLPVTLGYFILITGLSALPEDLGIMKWLAREKEHWSKDWSYFVAQIEFIWSTDSGTILWKLEQIKQQIETFFDCYPGSIYIKQDWHEIQARARQVAAETAQKAQQLAASRQNLFADFKWLRDHPIFGQFDSQPNTWYSHYGLKPTHLYMRWNQIFTSLDPYKDNFVYNFGGKRVFGQSAQTELPQWKSLVDNARWMFRNE